MIDFTSSLYLGMRHPSHALEPWAQLTSGKPAALGKPPRRARAVTQALAELQGCERVTLLPSTLHLFSDLFETLRRDGIRLYMDAATYPMARWGAERAAARGAPLRLVPHFDAAAVERLIAEDVESGLVPVIVADGFCAICGRPAPLRQYLRSVADYGGYVVLDDTQALGIWGAAPTPHHPYGSGGGGSLRRHGIDSPQIVVGSSLAKAFGVPTAALGGSAAFIRRFERQSETREHASPPSIAEWHAAEHALQANRLTGDETRRRLASLVACFRREIRRIGLRPARSLFPVQALTSAPEASAIRLHQALGDSGILTALVHGCADPEPRLTFVINATHTVGDIARAASVLTAALER